MAKNFIDLALKNPENANTQFYIYSRWPRRNEQKTKGDDGKETTSYSLDYAAKWNRPYTGGWDGTEETKQYFEKLADALRKEYPQRKGPILLAGGRCVAGTRPVRRRRQSARPQRHRRNLY
jgi:hypothetical protein